MPQHRRTALVLTSNYVLASNDTSGWLARIVRMSSDEIDTLALEAIGNFLRGEQ